MAGREREGGKREKGSRNERIILEGQLYSSKNSRRIFRHAGGKILIVKSKRAVQQERDMLWQLKDAIRRSTWQRMTAGKPLPLRLHILIYRATKQLFDYHNIVQNLMDILVKARYLQDDDADIVIPVFEPYQVDRLRPRAELWVA